MNIEKNAKRLFREEWQQLTDQERDVVEGIFYRMASTRDPNQEITNRSTIGQRAADVIAAFGGSWTFILLFGGGLLIWAFLNTEVLGPRHEAFDPYPYVFLNLILSMLAALQAPIIMMSQNRQSTRDRLEAEIDHEVNVRAELAIRNINERMHLIEHSLAELVAFIQPTATPDKTAATKD